MRMIQSVVKITTKYDLGHASQWLSWKNVALSVHEEVAPYPAEAVKSVFPASTRRSLFSFK